MNDNNDSDSGLLPVDRNGANHSPSGNGSMNGHSKNGSRNHRAPAPASSDTGWLIAEVLLQRRVWLFCGTLILASLGLAGGMLAFKRSSTAIVQLRRYEPMATGDFLKPPVLSQDTFASLLKSPDLLREVGSKLQPPVSVEMMSKIVFVKTDPDSDIIKVGVKGLSAQWAVDAANLYGDSAIRFTRELQQHDAQDVYNNFLKQRAQQMDGDIQELDEKFRKLPDSDFLTGQLNQLRGTVTNLNQQLMMPGQRPAGTTAMLSQQLQNAVNELSRLTRLYTDAHPLVQQERAEIDSLQQQIAQNAANPSAATTGGAAFGADYEIIRGKLQALANSRQLLADRQHEAESFAANPPGNIRPYAPATLKGVVADHYWLKVGLLTVLGGLLGFAFSAGGVLLVEFVDNRLKTAVDVQRVTQLPVIASLDDLKRKGPAAREKWAFRAWTTLQGRLSPSANHGLVCGITSSVEGEGRSTWIKLLADAASMSGFRVLTIATRPTTGGPKEDETEETSNPQPPLATPESISNAITGNALAFPAEVTQQLTGPDPQPSVHIPLPGWVWNLERRQQWQEALKQWRNVDNLVILIELPPASISESVLLGQNLPNLIWLTCSGMADAAETRMQIETLRLARCNLVGAVLNREPAKPLKTRFPRWLGCVALCCTLGANSVFGQDTNIQIPTVTAPPVTTPAVRTPPVTDPTVTAPDIIENNSTNLSFSIVNPDNRAEWQKHLTLGPGDILNFSVYGQPELSRTDVFIGPDGRVSFLEAQNILANGLTVDELRTNVDNELSKIRRAPHCIITPVAYRSKRYYVLGRVIQRGAYALDQPITVLEAVARAHGVETGLSDRNSIDLADLQKAFLARHGKRIPLDFQKLFEQGDLSQNIPLEPDDYLFFPAADLKEIYVLGEVRVPGVVPFSTDLTAVGAIVGRGGFSDRAYKSHVVVIRGSFSHPQTFVVDTLAVLDARGQDFRLQPRDIIYVSGRPFLRAEDMLDLAASAFIEASTAEWAGKYIGPLIHPGAIPGPP